ncbi:MAG: biotin/lipoyl-binding protein [Burkholderiaceae bacterium]|nr:biotin/lipoyl-binding protein [Burkholderiaceae bacterium]
MPRRTTIVVATLALALVAAAAAWLTRPPAAAALTLQSAPLLRTLQFSGRVEARSRVEAGSTLTGRVAAVEVREGDAVRAGQVLLRLDDA